MGNIKANDQKWIGRKFGKLTVTGFVFKNKRWLWECKCDCGGSTICYPNLLIRGKQKSCHCGKSITFHNMNYKHGGAGTRLYEIWCGMRKRCNNPNSKRYKNYGGRGIKIANEWEEYEEFQRWAVENGYQDGLTLERKDVDGDYCPENCTWIPLKSQALNKTSNIKIEIDGIEKPLSEWCKQFGLKYSTAYSRIHRGIDPEDAIKTPVAK